MKKALISPTEDVIIGCDQFAERIAEVRDEEYPVAEPCYWVDCEDDVTAETHCFKDGKIIIWPQPYVDEETGEMVNPYLEDYPE